MIDLNRQQLMQPSLPQYFETVGDVFEETLKKDGRVVGYFTGVLAIATEADVGEIGVGTRMI